MRRLVPVVLVLALATVPLTASSFVAMSPSELVAAADAVIEGRVARVDSFWSDSGRMIVTEAVVHVREVLVGEAGRSVTVRTFGGQVGDLMVEAHGFPVFERGEQVILFLKREESDGSLRVLGYQQGHFRQVTRLDGVTLAVPMVDAGMRYFRADGSLAPEPQSMLLNDFKAGVDSIARSQGRR